MHGFGRFFVAVALLALSVPSIAFGADHPYSAQNATMMVHQPYCMEAGGLASVMGTVALVPVNDCASYALDGFTGRSGSGPAAAANPLDNPAGFIMQRMEDAPLLCYSNTGSDGAWSANLDPYSVEVMTGDGSGIRRTDFKLRGASVHLAMNYTVNIRRTPAIKRGGALAI